MKGERKFEDFFFPANYELYVNLEVTRLMLIDTLINLKGQPHWFLLDNKRGVRM